MRPVIELETCVWCGARCDSETRRDPSDAEVAGAINSLNGEDRNDLYLRNATGAWVGIGGGPERFFVSYAAGEDGPFFEARDESATPGPEVELMVGGQSIRVMPQQLVRLADAIEVAAAFSRNGGRTDSVSWDER